MRVGLLEDDVAIQEMLLLVLQEEGHTVVNYPGAEECLELLGVTTQGPALTPIDVLIVDWRLNGLTSGVEVIQHIRASKQLESLPIILTTAATFSDTEALLNLHVALLEKPFAVDDIISLIVKLTRP